MENGGRVLATLGLVVLAGAVFSVRRKLWYGGLGARGRAELRALGDTVSTSPEEKHTADVLLLFGSQTGTAESFAKQLSKLCSEKRLTSRVVDLEDFQPTDLATARTAVLLLATYGEGEPTDNAQAFFKWLQGQAEGGEAHSSVLRGVRYAIFGLGNRQYVQFCGFSRNVDQMLSSSGAQLACPMGEGDDDEDLEEDFRKWQETSGLWAALSDGMPGTNTGGVIEEAQAEAQFTPQLSACAMLLRWSSDTHSCVPSTRLLLQRRHSHECTTPADAKEGFCVTGNDILAKWIHSAAWCSVHSKIELRQRPHIVSGLSTVHAELEFPADHDQGLDAGYQVGYTAEILGVTDESICHMVAERLQLSKDDLAREITYAVPANRPSVLKLPFPLPCNVHRALGMFTDLVQLPPKEVLRQLGCYLQSEAEQARLAYFLNHDTLWKMLGAARVSLLEFWDLFLTSLVMSALDFLWIMPRQKCRPYTISSSPRESNGRLFSVTIGMVQEQLPPLGEGLVEDLRASLSGVGPQGEQRLARLVASRGAGALYRGLTSSFACLRWQPAHHETHLTTRHPHCLSLPTTAALCVIRSSTFGLPRNHALPVIMVAAGTGIAPFRGFAEELRCRQAAGERVPAKSDVVLFFGCQSSQRDFIYHNLLEDHPNVTVFTAFSREQPDKVYVQHRLGEQTALVQRLLCPASGVGGTVFVCGSQAMGKAVAETVACILVAAGAADTIQSLQKTRRYVEELWG